MSVELSPEVLQMSSVIELEGGAYAAVTGLEYVDGGTETPVGNVLRRTCPVIGGQACAQTCQLSALRGEAPESAIGPDTRARIEALDLGPEGLDSYYPPECADDNLAFAIDGFGVERKQALIVGVTSGPDRIGFLDDPEIQAAITTNPSGWSEISGYNAFFAR
ncbi:MAG TPA: hypothetical protein VL737_04590, partial [Candidatus Pristimantibacillus sp.]|nr:hypothetical protein [Candidatus Pristimantibacillus sp.]